MDVWQWTPFVALIFLAGLSMVPVEIEEAARLETKSHWALLRYVQLPYLLPGLTAVLILRSADVLKLFDMVFVMTRGGPGAATDLISVYVQRAGFKVFNLGLASAQAILLLCSPSCSAGSTSGSSTGRSNDASPWRLGSILHAVGLLIVLAFALFPFYWMVTSSLKIQTDLLASPPIWLFQPTWRTTGPSSPTRPSPRRCSIR